MVEDSETREIEENIPDEGPAPVPTVASMKLAGNWCHHPRNILKKNTTVHSPPDLPEATEEELEAATQAQLKADPYEERLKPITKDAPVKGGAPAWTIRCHGDMTNYLPANPASAKLNFGVVVVRCNTWPGAFSFFTQQKLNQQVYLGDGLKFESQTFYPVQPPQMQADPVERLTYAEPNPTPAALERAKLAAQQAANDDGAAE